MGKFYSKHYANGLPDAVYEDGKVWRNYYANGLPDAVYEDGKIWFNYYANGLPDAVYEDGKIWKKYYANGLPDAVYEDGKVWNNYYANGLPDANTDPRFQVMYDCNPDGEYVAYDVRMSDTEITQLTEAKNKEYVQRGIIGASYFCKIDSQAVAGWTSYQGNFNIDGLWMSAAEVALIKAEAYLMGYGVEFFFKPQ